MKKGILYITPPGGGCRQEQLFRAISAHCPPGDYSSALYVTPDSSTLESIKNKFFTYNKKTIDKTTYIPFQSMTIKQLAAGLYDIYGSGNLISDKIRTLILCELIKGNSIGYARMLSDLYKKTKHSIPDKELVQIREDLTQLIIEEKARERAVEALSALMSYNREAERLNLIDPDEMLRKCTDMIRQHPDVSTLVISGFYDPSHLEMNILTELIARADRVFIQAEENTEISRHLISNQKCLEIKKMENHSNRKGVSFCSYPSIEEEVEGIAKHIRKLMIEGMKPWQVTVCFPSPAKYLSLLRRVFRRYQIPVNIDGMGLSSSKPLIAVLDMLTCMEEDYPAKDFLSFITAPFFSAIPTTVRDRAVGHAYSSGIVKGRQSWLSVRDTLLNSSEKNWSERELEQINEIQAVIERTISTIESVKAQKNLAEFISAFESALESLGFFDYMDNSQQWTDIRGKITGALNDLRRFAELSKTERHYSEFTKYLRYMLQDMQGAKKNISGVNVRSFEMAAGIESTALFIGGMIEGDFPSKPGIDPILPEKVKKELGMPYLDYYLKRQKLYFNRLINVSSMEPFISYPSADGEKIFLPSPFLDWSNVLATPDFHIFTEEDSLTSLGIQEGTSLSEDIFLGGDLAFDKQAFQNLQRRTSVITKKYISVSDLDYYRKCPRRFYIEKVLGVELDAPPRFEVESRLWGSLAHHTMENLFRDGDVHMEDLENKLFQSLQQSLKKFPLGEFWSKVAREIFQHLLPLIKKQEENLRQKGFSPALIESSRNAEIQGIRLRGKIDRIDRMNGEAKDRPVILIDYKTGNADRDSLQLPLYAWMWEDSMPEPVENAGYYSLKDGSIKWLASKKGLGELVREALKEAEHIIQCIKSGEYPRKPFKETSCRYCDHKPLCGGPRT